VEVNCDGRDWNLGWADDSGATNVCNYLWTLRVVGVFKERVKIGGYICFFDALRSPI
jgi:hypothetical protein